MGTLVSVNVGMPKDVPWHGKTVLTGVFKDPVTGPRWCAKLNVDGDGQGDLAGHGGEQRAVFVYQLDSYRYWERELGRTDFVYGQFGENLTVEGLADDEVCIGDRYRIGGAALRGDPTPRHLLPRRHPHERPAHSRPARLTHRPGFYFRVLQEGDVEAGDEIVKVASGPEQMTVAEVDALLYLPGPPAPAAASSAAHSCSQPGLASFLPRSARRRARQRQRRPVAASPPPAWDGFRRLTVTGSPREQLRVSIRLDDPAAHSSLALPGQSLRSVSSATASRGRCSATTPSRDRPDAGYYRISVKREPTARPAAICTAGSPSAINSTSRHHVAPSRSTGPCARAPDRAGIGATPVSPCFTRWRRSVQIARSGGCTAPAAATSTSFAAETRALLASLPNVCTYVYYSRPGRHDLQGRDFDSAGRLTASLLADSSHRRDAEAYLCGPTPFMEEIGAGWLRCVDASCIHTEPFGPAPGLTPGIAATRARTPTHLTANPETAQRSSSPAATSPYPGASCASLLELAEACDVPVRWSCRTGVCHNCETTLIAGGRRLQPRPGRTSCRRKRAHLLLTATRTTSSSISDDRGRPHQEGAVGRFTTTTGQAA